MGELYKKFKNPPNQYRGKPFWSWNGLLEREKLIRQVHVMKKMGFGGYFMHSRAGLETEYLGEEWFELINACADEGEKLGMESWLYDEDRWPSGSAGGIVTRNPEYRAKFLRLSIVESHGFEWKDNILAAFAADIDDENLKGYERFYKDSEFGQLNAGHVLVFTTEEMIKSSNYNGYTYLDTLKREATEKFIDVTHKRYREKCGDRLGREIKGIFIDEPHRGQFMAAANNINPEPEWIIPWTESIFEDFKERFGYDVVNHLPEIYLKYRDSEVSQVRWHYIELLQQLFIENFVEPINIWCKENGLILTGHFLHEDSLTAQTWTSGSIMRLYEHMEYPGVDVLTEGNRNFWIVKQLSSAARQLDKEWMLSELYGCTGWQTNFESHKEMGDWQTLLGINLRCHHLSWYTMKGEAKRDYPPSILHQSPWWKDYKYVEDYFSRIHVVMSQGAPCCHTLVINPVESVWALARHGWIHGLEPGLPVIHKIEEMYQNIFYWLMGCHIDFDYGDEDMISRLYSIEQDTQGMAILKIGETSYKQVLVAGMMTIRSSTLKILDEFLKAGGKVVFAGEPPKYVDALESAKARDMASKSLQVPFEKDGIVKALKNYDSTKIEIIDGTSGESIEDIYVQVREDKDSLYLFMLNISLDKTYENAEVRLNTDGFIEEWDCRTGERFEISRSENGKIEFTTDFTSNGERLYIIRKHKSEGLSKKQIFQTKEVLDIYGDFEYELDEPNVLVLDMAKFRIEDGQWQTAHEILEVDRKIRDHFGMEYRSGEMLQPWFIKKEGYKDKGKVQLSFEFYIEEMPSEDIELVLEDPEIFEVELNGHSIDTYKQSGWWVDICFKRIPIRKDLLVHGKNTIKINTMYNQGVDLEALYILGNFGVRLEESKKTLTALPQTLAIGDIVSQGLPFYSGKIKYFIPINYQLDKGERMHLNLERIDGACVKVSGEDGLDKMIAWKPYEADITELLRDSDGVYVEVIPTRRNTFGPLHQRPAIAPSYGPWNFVTEGTEFTMDYMLLPVGLTTNPKIIIMIS